MAARFGQTRAANLYPDKPSAVDASRSAHDLFQLISHSLRNTKSVSTDLTFPCGTVVPLGSFFGGCPPPPVTFPATRLNFRRATWLPFSGSFPKGATRFYPGAQENLSALPSKPFGFSAGRYNNCKPLCRCPLPESHDSVRQSLRRSQRP
jgi:hypothetical protein